MVIRNFIRSYKRIKNAKRFFLDYKSQLSRIKINTLHTGTSSRRDYLFFAGSLWKKEDQTNRYRANFITACRSIPNVFFEGGFAPRLKRDIPGFENLTMDQRVEQAVYFTKIKESAVVFNTPAVASCHGWKLGEFLCMGKAILSTSLSRLLPMELEDGKHLMLTDGSVEDIRSKIMILLENENLHKQLEQEAQAYFHHWLSPEKVIARLLENRIPTTVH